MKRIVFLVLLLCQQAITHAQLKTIAEGPVFDEPETGFARIMQMKNGNTMFFRIRIKEGIELQIYDAKHKQKVVKHLGPAYGKLKMGSIDGIFEINGDAVLLISEVDAKAPVLYRLIIDGNTGNLKKEETLATLKRFTMGQGYALKFGHAAMPDFFVRKDPYSDHYAVAMFNSFESDRNKRIEVVLYGPDHQEISRAYYASPDNKYKYLEYIDMAVLGGDKVCIMAYAYNTRASGGKESELVLASLDKGSSTVTLNEMAFTHADDIKSKNGILRYNPATKKAWLLTALKKGKKGSTYECFLNAVDPFSQKMEKGIRLFPEKANRKAIELFGSKGHFDGLPQNMFINNDDSFSIVYEELEVEVYTDSKGRYTTVNTQLGNMAVSTYDINGKETSCYFIPKKHYLTRTDLPVFYHSDREGTAQKLEVGNQFKSFAYLNGKDRSYIMFNDVEENTERVLKGKITRIIGVSECDGFCYTLQGNEVMPARDFVFGKPGKREHNLALFAISDYDRENNLYVTLKLEKEGHNKGVRLVWMTP